METISIIAVSIISILIFLLLIKKEKIKADRYLLAFVFTILVGVLNDLFYSKLPEYRNILVIGSMTVPLCAALLFMYFKSLITDFKILKIKHLLLFVPAVFILIFNFYYPEYDIVQNQNVILIVFYYSIKLGFSLLMIILSKIQLINYRKALKQNVSELENVDFKWLHFIINLSLGLFAMVFVFLALYQANIITTFDYLGLFIGSAIFVFILILAYYGIKNTQTFRDIIIIDPTEIIPDKKKDNENKHQKAENIDIQIDDCQIKILEQIMKDKKPHLIEKLNITEFSEKTNISQKQLSLIINKHYNQNFFDFINSYRIQEFNKKIEKGESKNFTILALALDCGFSSKSAFNRAYKKHMGVPPSEYLKSGTNATS